VVFICRFDLLHVMLDELTEEDDGRIATHIVALHKDPAATIGRAPFTMEQLQRFIKYARSIKPRITKEVGLSCQHLLRHRQ
jgi:DNA replication licensing factor MCM6